MSVHLLTCASPNWYFLAVWYYLVVKEEETTEEAVEISCEQREIDRGGAGPLHHHRHEAVQAEHEGTETDVEKTCSRTKGANCFSLQIHCFSKTTFGLPVDIFHDKSMHVHSHLSASPRVPSATPCVPWWPCNRAQTEIKIPHAL